MIKFFALSCIANLIVCSENNDSQIDKMQKAWSESLIKKIGEREHSSVVDLWCGTGVATECIASMCPRTNVYGVDSDGSKFSSVAEKIKHYNPPVVWLQTDILDFLNKEKNLGHFSGIASFSALHWLSYTSLKETLRGCYKAAQKDGYCYFSLAGKQEIPQRYDNYLTQAVTTTMRDDRWADCFAKEHVDSLDDDLIRRTKSIFCDLCKEVGFKVEEAQLKEERYSFTSEQQFHNWIETMSPYKKVVREHHKTFVAAVLQNYLKLSPALPDGSVVYVDYMLNAILKKS